MILSRTTAEAVSSCLGFIRRGVEAYVLGREIGKGLVYLLEKVSGGDIPTAEVITRLDAYWVEKSAILTENKLMALEDRILTLKAIAEDCSTSLEMVHKIVEIFNTERGIQHMTMHKAKGLECDGDVYTLNPSNIPHPRAKQVWQREEEYRLLYVAITRAKRGLFYVGK